MTTVGDKVLRTFGFHQMTVQVLVSMPQGLLRNLARVLHGVQGWGVRKFHICSYIMLYLRNSYPTVTIECEYEVICDLSNGVIANELE